ncbi:hypothetical protein BH20ACT4_BH20ACT4_13610 [soil metagenome]
MVTIGDGSCPGSPFDVVNGEFRERTSEIVAEEFNTKCAQMFAEYSLNMSRIVQVARTEPTGGRLATSSAMANGLTM